MTQKLIPSKGYKGPVYDSDNGYPERSNMNRYDSIEDWIHHQYYCRTYDETTDFSRWHLWGGQKSKAFIGAKQIIKEAIDNLDLAIRLESDEVDRIAHDIFYEVEEINKKLPEVWELDDEVSIAIDKDLIKALMDFRAARLAESDAERQKEVRSFMGNVQHFEDEFKKGVEYNDKFVLKLVPNTRKV